MLDALMRSPSGEAPWWAEVPISDDGLDCLALSKHPDARRLLILGRGPALRQHLLDDVDATVPWMGRWLLHVESSPPGAMEAWRFWSLFDVLPLDRKVDLLPAVRRVAAMEFVDTWHQRGWRHEALQRLGKLGDVESLPMMRVALGDSRNWWLQAAAAAALGELGAPASTALDELKSVATKHWSAEVRAVADHAAARVSGGDPPDLEHRRRLQLRDPGDPTVYLPTFGPSRVGAYRSLEPSSVMLDGERIEFEAQHRVVPALPAELESFDLAARFPDAPGVRSWRSRLTAVERVGSGWVLGTNMGEFGGGAWFVEADGRARVLLSQNISGVIEFAGTRYLLQGLGHMGISDGSVLRMDETPGGVELRRMVELPAAPRTIAVMGEQLLQATAAGVAVVSPSFEIELHPYATQRPPPVEPPSGYAAAVFAATEQDHDAVQRCLAPLKGLTDGCVARTIPAGTSVWFDVDTTGTVTAVVPFAARYDDYGRPPTPEVAACIERVAASWTLPPLDSGWTTFGMTLEPD